MHGHFGSPVSILPLPEPRGTAQGCISQLSNSVLPFSSPKMELTLLRFSGTGIGGHFFPVALQALSQTLCRSSLALGQLLWDRRAPVCRLRLSPSPASTAPGLVPVYAHGLMEPRWGFMLLPSWKWEAHHDKSFNVLYLTFHGGLAVLSALPGPSCPPHGSGGTCLCLGMSPLSAPCHASLSWRLRDVVPPHRVPMGRCLPRDSSSSSRCLRLASAAPGRAQTTLQHPELFSFPPGEFYHPSLAPSLRRLPRPAEPSSPGRGRVSPDDPLALRPSCPYTCLSHA